MLTVVGLGPLALRGRTGTTMCDEGLRRHFLFHVVQLRWEDIEGFSDERAFARTRGVSRTSVVAVRVRARPPVASIAVPSELHTTSSDKARALAEYLNRYFRHDTVDGASDIDSARLTTTARSGRSGVASSASAWRGRYGLSFTRILTGTARRASGDVM